MRCAKLVGRPIRWHRQASSGAGILVGLCALALVHDPEPRSRLARHDPGRRRLQRAGTDWVTFRGRGIGLCKCSQIGKVFNKRTESGPSEGAMVAGCRIAVDHRFNDGDHLISLHRASAPLAEKTSTVLANAAMVLSLLLEKRFYKEYISCYICYNILMYLWRIS